MQANAKGKFCGSCQKAVIDFTHFSDRDLQNWFNKNQSESCGRFKQDQLDRLIQGKSNYTLTKFKPGLVAASLLAFLSFPKLSKGEIVKPSIIQTEKTPTNFEEKIQDKEFSDSLRVIKGKITDKDKLALPAVSIRILGEKYGCSTNANGEFSLTYLVQKEIDLKELEIRYIGCENKNVKFKSTDAYLNITLNEDPTAFMGDVVVVRTPFWRKIYNKTRNQLRDINPFYKKLN
ncbi:hypothetical protein D3C85_1146520 [compost metagenome]